MKIDDNIYSNTYQLHTYQTDPFLTAELPFYCRSVQEGAASHAMHAGCANRDLSGTQRLEKAGVILENLSNLYLHSYDQLLPSTYYEYNWTVIRNCR